MAVKKLVCANYLRDVPADTIAANEQNRCYVDRFVSENYKRLSAKFSNLDGVINSSGFGAMDKLNETIVSLYTDPELSFSNWEEAEQYMSNKFTEKAIRVPVKKLTVKDGADEEEGE